MAARKSGTDAYNNGEGLFLILCCFTVDFTDVFSCELSIGSRSARACSFNVHSSNVFYSFFSLLSCAQDPSATLMMFPSRLMTNFAAQRKWGCLLVSVCQTASLCWWTHRLVRYSKDGDFALHYSSTRSF